MLSLRALGREDEALVAEQAYQYYQIDESAQELTRRYRLEHPHDNREALKIHVHPLGEGWLGAVSVEGERGEFPPCLASALGRPLG